MSKRKGEQHCYSPFLCLFKQGPHSLDVCYAFSLMLSDSTGVDSASGSVNDSASSSS